MFSLVSRRKVELPALLPLPLPLPPFLLPPSPTDTTTPPFPPPTSLLPSSPPPPSVPSPSTSTHAHTQLRLAYNDGKMSQLHHDRQPISEGTRLPSSALLLGVVRASLTVANLLMTTAVDVEDVLKADWVCKVATSLLVRVLSRERSATCPPNSWPRCPCCLELHSQCRCLVSHRILATSASSQDRVFGEAVGMANCPSEQHRPIRR